MTYYESYSACQNEKEIKSKKFGLTDTENGRRIQSDIHAGFDSGIECALQVIDKYMERSE